MVLDNFFQSPIFYFITDDSAKSYSMIEQVKTAICAGATIIQYRNKAFSPEYFDEVLDIRNLCKCNFIPFLVNDDIVLAKAVGADGVHLGQDDKSPYLARKILGDHAIVGLSVSTGKEFENSDLSLCDYIGTGPVFPTKTKADAKKVCGLSGLEAISKKVKLPVVAIGGINSSNAKSCFDHGAKAVAVISYISMAKNPYENALKLGSVCKCLPRDLEKGPWNDEFELISKLTENVPCKVGKNVEIIVPPGDDACLLSSLNHPVISTDTQKEGVHFRSCWQTPEEIGYKAVVVTLSDLAASYACPVSLFVNLALPDYISEKTVKSLYSGLNKALTQYECSLGGGNISRASEFSIDLFAIGECKTDLFPKRSGAVVGDGLYCTGALGLAKAGLYCLEKKDTTYNKLIEKFKFPCARFDASEICHSYNVMCVIDISDGLAGDARHVAVASDLTIELDLHSFAFDEKLILFSSKYNMDPLEIAVSGGEDYELLFACNPDVFEKIKVHLPDAYQVGRCVPFNGNFIENLPFPRISSFQHGKKKTFQSLEMMS